MNHSISRWLPITAIALATVAILYAMTPPSDRDGTMRLQAFKELLAVDGGRHKPIDTFARTQLMIISGRQTYRDTERKGHDAVVWLLDVMARGLANYYDGVRIVSVGHPEVRQLLGLDKVEKRPTNLYLVSEFAEKWPALIQEAERVRQLPADQWTEKDRAIFDVTRQVFLIMGRVETSKKILDGLARRKVDDADLFWIESDEVLGMLSLPKKDIPRYSRAALYRSEGYEKFRARARKLDDVDRKTLGALDAKIVEFDRHVQLEERIASLGGALMIPPEPGGENWTLLGKDLMMGDRGGHVPETARRWERLVVAYGTGDVEGFNKAVAELHKEMDGRYQTEARLARVEVWFNQFEPFYLCAILYVVIFLMTCVSWVAWRDELRWTAFGLAALTLLLHTAALCLRMYIQGRPPITNLYSTAVFIGWFCLLMCLIMEGLFRNGLGNLVAAGLGFATTVISMHLGSSGDTLEMMQAVLDTNFWLATHVTTINIGYAATMVAGCIGIAYIIRGLFTTTLDQKEAKEWGTMMYGALCFATLLSFVGTVLGGLWADQSWGRFWGWDPKENGALLIVIMNALILHARWGGMIKERGMAVLAIVGNMITAWSWFGTNQLSIGLHAYGFNPTLAVGCRWFWLSQLVLIGLGLTPLRYWRSFNVKPPVVKPAVPAKAGPRAGQRGSTAVMPG